MTNQNPAPLPGQPAHVFEAEAICVTSGANHGDPLGAPEACLQGDVYQLSRNAVPARLVLATGGAGQSVAAGSQIGAPGDAVALGCAPRADGARRRHRRYPDH